VRTVPLTTWFRFRQCGGKFNSSARIYNAPSGLGLFKSGRGSIGSGDSLVFADARISGARLPAGLDFHPDLKEQSR
jgi:hypothetical protein